LRKVANNRTHRQADKQTNNDEYITSSAEMKMKSFLATALRPGDGRIVCS